MEFEFDMSDFTDWADDLDRQMNELPEEIRPVVAKGAVKVKAAMRADMAESRHFKQAARTISFDFDDVFASYSEAQVGPATGGPGSIANIAYFGGAKGGGGTVRDPQEALDDEAGPFVDALSAVLKTLG